RLGRFLSADTIVPNPLDPQDLNRFSYVRNNPLRYIDPSGHDPMCGFSYSDPECVSPDPWVPPSTPANTNEDGSDYGLDFQGNGDDGDIDAFVTAVVQEANAMYEVYCQELDSACEYSSPADLYVATHGTTVITFSNTAQDFYCERNTNAGQEGVICYANSRGYIDPYLAAHEMGHVFNALIVNNGQSAPHTDLANERRDNAAFPDITADITPGHLSNRSRTDREDFANMYSMWVFDDWLNTPGGEERRLFMENNMLYWIIRLLP
ncbi:MAG: hypothetical protein DWB48_07870, partial [Nitrosomonas sp.]|nr:hypothetical protein [Nitrosomonas sp.]